MLKFFQYFVLVFSFFLKLNGQVIDLNILASSKKSEVAKLNYQKKFASKTQALSEIDNIIKSLHYKGYLLANVDTIFSDSTHILICCILLNSKFDRFSRPYLLYVQGE